MLTTTDLFCGAGGSGLGAHAAGFDLVIAANHWQRAIDTHAANFPDTEHDCADISQVDPRRYPATDVLWASPECTNHSQAKGAKRLTEADMNDETLPDDAAERSRATMFDVPRFVERMILRGRPYQAIIVENVVEAVNWLYWPSWLMGMHLAGYDHQLVSLNSMHAPAINAPRAPQSRDRLYIVFHRQGNKKPNVTPTPLAYCADCDQECNAVQTWKNGRTVGKYRLQYYYACPARHTVDPYALPASTAIDWSTTAQRIGDRTRPLSPKTMERIAVGLQRYAASQGLIVPVEGRDGKQATPADRPMRTLTARRETALLVPYNRTGIPVPTSLPAPTMTTVDPAAVVEPSGAFIAELRGMSASHNKALHSVGRPLPIVTAGGNHHGLVQPSRSLSQAIDEATFRMLNPPEIQTAMAFPSDYKVLGIRREQVRQLGNGVTPPASEFLYRAVADSLA